MGTRGHTNIRNRSRGVITVLAALSLIGSLAAPSGAYERPGFYERVSVSSDGKQANGHSGSIASCPSPGSLIDHPAMTPDGRYVAFTSVATNLDPRDRNGRLSDVFVHDRKTKKTEIISVNSLGLSLPPPPDLGLPEGACRRWSYRPAISDNGRYVAFFSEDRTLTEDAASTCCDGNVFVHDRRNKTTKLVSPPTSDEPGGGANRDQGHAISGNGRYVAYTNLGNVYVHDRAKGESTVASVALDGAPAGWWSWRPSLSRNGRYLVFDSEASNLTDDLHTPGCFRGQVSPVSPCRQIYLRDLKTGENELISVNRDERPGNGRALTGWTSNVGRVVSANGRYVLFESSATDLVPAGAGGIFVRDRKAGRTERVNVTSWGAITGFGIQPSLSPDGRFVGTTMVVPVTEEEEKFMPVVHDRLLGSSVAAGPVWMDECSTPPSELAQVGDVSAGGRYLSFATDCDSVVSGDTNQVVDAFVHDRGDPVGVGGLFGAPPPQEPDEEEPLICIAPGVCIPPMAAVSSSVSENDLSDALTATGANLYGASLAHRSELGDLFAAIELESMGPSLAGGAVVGSPWILYGLRFEVDGARYEVRATSLAGGSFGLFDCTESAPLCTQLTTLKGGYGTTGERVVFSLPLDEIGLEKGGKLKDVVAWSGIGSYLTGASKILDSVRIR